jgi:tetratricopeptide (TPR) repeat protein
VELSDTGRNDLAADMIGRAVALQRPQNPDWLFNLGLACERLGRWPKAVERFRQAVAVRPSSSSRAFPILWQGLRSWPAWSRRRVGAEVQFFIILCVSTWADFVYVAFVVDAYARRIVGRRLSDGKIDGASTKRF